MKQSAALQIKDDCYADWRNVEAENQELRDQNHRLRLAMEEAARLIWIKPTEAEKILSTALK
jgi:hypothetical protein